VLQIFKNLINNYILKDKNWYFEMWTQKMESSLYINIIKLIYNNIIFIKNK